MLSIYYNCRMVEWGTHETSAYWYGAAGWVECMWSCQCADTPGRNIRRHQARRNRRHGFARNHQRQRQSNAGDGGDHRADARGVADHGGGSSESHAGVTGLAIDHQQSRWRSAQWFGRVYQSAQYGRPAYVDFAGWPSRGAHHQSDERQCRLMGCSAAVDQTRRCRNRWCVSCLRLGCGERCGQFHHRHYLQRREGSGFSGQIYV